MLTVQKALKARARARIATGLAHQHRLPQKQQTSIHTFPTTMAWRPALLQMGMQQALPHGESFDLSSWQNVEDLGGML